MHSLWRKTLSEAQSLTNAPHIREWWGEPETELGYIIDMVEGRDTTKPYIFYVNGEPTGYIQVWRIGPHQTEDWTQGQSLAHGACRRMPVGVDLSIGEADKLSKGIGSAVLAPFVDKLKAEGHTAIIIDPDPENNRAVRAYDEGRFQACAPIWRDAPKASLSCNIDSTANEINP